MSLEAVILTGGASRRMGSDKASLVVGGETLAERTVRILSEGGMGVTVLGREPVEGASFVQDEGEFEGPLVALSAFRPEDEWIFVTSCDLPNLNRFVVDALFVESLGVEAVVPVIDGRRQPLCAMYSRAAFDEISPALAEGKRSMMAWLERLTVKEVDLCELTDAIQGANTPEEFRKLTS